MLTTRRQHGFTMIELMITLVIAGILLAIGVPSYRAVLQNARSAAVASDLTTAINLARAESIRRGEPVTVCPSSNATTCSGAWTAGWITRVPSSGDVLRVWEAPTPGTVVTQTPSANTALNFGSLGELTSGDTVLVASVDGCTSDRARSLTLGASGRVSVSRTNCP
jgi:type IV fimbrial biogenesis protein FimT